MLWVQVAFHENDGNHENDEDNSDGYKQEVEMTKTTRIQGANHGFPKPRV